jgi:predicted nucleic acid-binding protein
VTDKVVDASAVAALLFDETTADKVAASLHDHRLFAPALFYTEFANVFLKKVRANPAMRDVFLAAFDRLDQMAITLVDVDVRAALTLAERHKLSACDASYLWLAHELEIELVTLDQRLQKAASSP